MMFLTSLVSPTPSAPVELVEGTLSGVTVAGVVVALITCALVAAAAGIAAYKMRGNAGGALMAFIMGGVGAIIAPSLANIVFQLFQGVRLTSSEKAGLVFLGFSILALVTAAVDAGVRYYVLFYMDKTGLGLHKGMSIAGGYAFGSVIRYLTNLFYTTLYVFAIKNGTFVTEEMKVDIESYNQRATFQNAAMLTPTGTYFAYALQFVAVALLYVTLTIYMIRTWLEEKKGEGVLVSGCAMFAFELVRGLSAAGFTAKKITESQQYMILAALYVVVIAACVVALLKVLNDYPKGREKFMKTMRQRAEEAEKKQQKSAWSQINAYNSKAADDGDSREDDEMDRILEADAALDDSREDDDDSIDEL